MPVMLVCFFLFHMLVVSFALVHSVLQSPNPTVRQPFTTLTGDDVLLSYLPLPHIFERMVQSLASEHFSG